MFVEDPYTPRPGDYGVVSTRGWIGETIQRFTRSYYNHAFIYVGNGVIVEAQPNGVRFARLRQYDHVVWNRHDEITDAQRDAIVAYAKTLIGTPYNFLDIAALFLTCIGLHWRWLEKRVAREDRLMCSQLVDVCYVRAGIHLFTDTPPQAVKPVDLADRLLYV